MDEAPDQHALASVSHAQARPYARLFAAVVLLFILQVGLDDSDVARFAQVIVGSSVLILAARLGQVSGRWWMAVRLGVVIAVVSSIANVLLGDIDGMAGAVLIVNGLVVAAAPPAVIRAIRRHPTVTIETVLGAVTVYVLIGLFFAFVFRSILEYDASSFQTSVGELTPAAMQYLSFVSLTTVGFGDVTPVSDLARTLVSLEALVGQVYLVTVVALVVGNIGTKRRKHLED
jgi:hypothetical protein